MGEGFEDRFTSIGVVEPEPLNLERIVELTPAFDRRDPRPSRNYGIHSVELRMILKGPLGATQFVLYTGWHLPHVDIDVLDGLLSRCAPAPEAAA